MQKHTTPQILRGMAGIIFLYILYDRCTKKIYKDNEFLSYFILCVYHIIKHDCVSVSSILGKSTYIKLIIFKHFKGGDNLRDFLLDRKI